MFFWERDSEGLTNKYQCVTTAMTQCFDSITALGIYKRFFKPSDWFDVHTDSSKANITVMYSYKQNFRQ